MRDLVDEFAAYGDPNLASVGATTTPAAESGLVIESWPVGRLVPYEGNPRVNGPAAKKIANLIREYGFRNPIEVDAAGVILRGHTRLKAAQILGLESVPVIVCRDLTPEQARAWRIADNASQEWAHWDEDLLKVEIEALQSVDFDLSLTGLDSKTLDGFLIEKHESTEEEDEVSPAEECQQRWNVERGQLWVAGRHRILCGDSTDPGQVARLMGGGAADLFLTDPPYNVAYVGGTSHALSIANDQMADAEFRRFLVSAFSAADSAMRPGAAFYIWHADSEGFNFRGACRDVGWQVRQCVIWNKNTLVLGRQDYHWKHEPCLYGWKEGAAHFWGADRTQTTVIDFDRPTRSESHPTMKPVGLFAYLIRNSTNRGGVVLDLFGGSGTSIVASEQTGRACYAMELEPKYVAVALDRLSRLGLDPKILD